MKFHHRKKKQTKKMIAGLTATVLAVSLGTVAVLSQTEPLETYAKESFSGTKQVVDEHTGDSNPFVILDVVPSYATYQWDNSDSKTYEISTGTLGYFVNGQNPMASDYVRIYKDLTGTDATDSTGGIDGTDDTAGSGSTADLSTYGKRAGLVNEIWTGGNSSSDTFFHYEEAYGSGNTRKDLNSPAANGWTLLIDTKVLPESDAETGDTAHKGMMKGTFVKYPDISSSESGDSGSGSDSPSSSPAASPSKTGYDYIKVSSATATTGEQSYYVFDNAKGSYQVKFKQSTAPATSGYTVEYTDAITSDNKNQYGSATGLYKMNDNNDYEYAGTIEEKFPDTETETGTGTGEETAASTGLYIVTFEYQTNIDQETNTQTLYEVDGVTEIDSDTPTEDRPYDAYSMEGEESSDEPPESTDRVFLYVGSGKGDYKLTDQADMSAADKKKQTPVWMEVRNAPTYFRFNNGCDWLKQYVFHSLSGGDNNNSDFKIEVQTVRADDLTAEQVNSANLVYFEDGTAPFINLSSKNEKTTLHYLSDFTKKTTQEDGSTKTTGIRENTYALAYKAAIELLPVMVDYDIVSNDNYKDSDYQKLAKIFLKDDLENYVNDAQTSTDWLLNNADNSDYSNRTDNNNHYVNRNIYIINSSKPLVDRDFASDFDDSSANSGFSEVLELIKSENSKLSSEDAIAEKVSKAKAIEYIINYSIGFTADFTDLRILELQPTQNDASDLIAENPTDNSTTIYWQRSTSGSIKKQVLRSSGKLNVDITREAVAAFNSKLEDLNQHYNLVFIGLDGQKLNHTSSLWNSTQYNDSNLNTLLYHTGDLAVGSSERYDASDITERGKEALLEFLQAGYPVLVENDFFVGKSAKNGSGKINTKYIASDTELYAFLKQAADNYSEQLYTIDDVHSSVQFMAQLKLNHPVIEVTSDTTVPLAKASNGELSAVIPYSVTDLSGDSYDNCHVEVYLDLNDDGYFAQQERMDNSTSGDIIHVTAGDGQATILFTQPPGSRAVPYQLKVVDNENSYLRASADGLLTITSTDTTKESVRILQIGTKGDDSLSSLYKKDNSLLGYCLKVAENTMNVRFEIETMDSATLETKLASNSNYLNQWDLLVLGFGSGSESVSATVQNSILSYCKAGRSVLVTGKAASENRLLADAELLGQLNENKTYGKLGGQYGLLYRYSGLNADMLGAQSNLGVSGINEGSVYSYPNSVGKSAKLSGSYQSYQYLLDINNEITPYVTPWFVFTGQDSGDNAYDLSPGDGANNYYLYNRSNLVFIGNGDYASYIYDAAATPSGASLQECQLFVNAMMLAYDAGVHNLKVSIVDSLDESAVEVTSINVPFDQISDSEDALLDDAVDACFKFKNSNLTLSNTYEVRFYYENSAGGTSLDIGDEVVKVTPFTSSLWTVQNNTLTEVSAADIRQGKVYQFKIPTSVASVSNARIFVEITSTLNRPGCTGGDNNSVRGYAYLTLNRTQLFMLE